MPATPATVRKSSPDLQSIALIDQVWARLHARLERRITRLEASVSALFDRSLDESERVEALELCDEIAHTLGTLGFPAAADLVRRVLSVLTAPGLGMSEAISMAGMLDDARGAIASVVADLRLVNHSGFRLLIVGPQNEAVDKLIWLSASQSLRVTHDFGGGEAVPGSAVAGSALDGNTDEGGSTDESADDVEEDFPIAAVLVVVDDTDLGRARSLLRGIREEYPRQPVVLVAPETPITGRAPLADVVTTILSAEQDPLAIVTEVRQAVIRSCYPMTASVIGISGVAGTDELTDQLKRRGVAALAERTGEELLESLASGRSRAVVIGPETSDIEPLQLLHIIRSDSRLRSTVVVMIERRQDSARVHSLRREGADEVVSTDVDADDLAVIVKAGLARRAVLEPVEQTDTTTGVVAWDTAVVLVERMLSMSFRRHAPVGLAIVEFESTPEELETGRFDANLAREFRREDVISRAGDGRLVIALQGVNRATILRRIEQLHQKFGLHERGGRAAVVQFPIDGRSFEELMDEGERTLASAGVDGVPQVLGHDWQPVDRRAADILLVDPDTTLGSVLTSTLKRRGLTVQQEPDALDALELLTARTRQPLPKIVLLELDLRGVDGLQFLRQIREAGVLERSTVIVLSARTNESDLRQAFELGAEDFVPKPFSTPLLLHRLHRALNP